MDCTSVVEVLAEDKEICSEHAVDILVETSDGSSADIIVEVVEEGNTSGAQDWTFTGSGVIPDVIENEGDDIEVVIYEAYALSPPSICRGPITTIEVIVYPEIEIIPDDPYYLCYGMENEVTPEISGGTGGPYEVEWSNGETGLSIFLPQPIDLPPGEYSIEMVVTDDLGCTGIETVEYEILEPVEPNIIAPITAVCKDGVDDMVTMTLEFMDVGTGPYDYKWDSTPGGLDFDGSSTSIDVVIDEENSTSKTYTIFGIVTDDFGCEYRAETSFVVDNGPELEFAIEQCFGVGYDLTGYIFGLDPVTFEIYYDEDGDWNQQYETLVDELLVHGPVFGNSTNYFAEQFGQYILVGTSENGCKDFFILDVPPLATPIFSTIPNDTVCAGTTVTIKVDNFLDFVEFDWSTGGTLDSIVVTPADTTTYYLEAELNNGCEVIDSIIIVVNPIPPVNITGSASFCPGEFTTLTAQGDSTNLYAWNGPNGELINTQSAQINVPGSWNILITTPSGCTNNENISVVQDDELNPQIIGGNFCSGESVMLDGGPGFDSYTWFDFNNIVLGTDPTLEVSQEGNYILEVFLGNCNGLDTFLVEEIEPLPYALTTTIADVCNIDSGSLPTSIDLTSYENGNAAGEWFNENGIPVADPTFIEFAGAMPSSLVYTFTTTEATFPCENDTYNFTINILDCACPSVAINPPPNFCVGTDTFDLSLIQITTEPGTWSVNDPEIEILNNTLLITGTGNNPGDYSLTYTLDNTSVPASCAVSNTVDFTINAPPEAQIITNADVCNLDTGNGPDFIDLDDLYISGSSGDWSTNEAGLMIDSDNVVSFTGQLVESYDFFYLTNDALSPCQNVNYTTIIDVLDCSCPPLELNTLPTLCSSGGTFDLDDYIDNPNNEPGNWSVSGPDNSVLIGSNFTADGAPEGDYTITFTFNTTQGGSCINEVSQTVTILDQPFAMITEQIVACNGTNLTTFPVSVDLTSVVTGDDGFWTAPADYNNGMIDDVTDVNFEGVEPGIYPFIYTTNTAMAPCADVEVVLNLEVVNCNCPILAFNPPSPLCNDGTETNLNTLLYPEVGEGIWTFVNGPQTPLMIGDSIFVVNEIAEGQYTFEYSLSDMVPAGCLESSQITLEVFESPDVQVIPQAVACNTMSVQGPVCLDLNTFVVGANGTWNAPTNFTGDFSDISNVCFEGETVGSTFEFVFLTNTAITPCTDKRLTTIITIIDCNCPNLTVSVPQSICNAGGSIDVSALEDPSIAAGSWTVIAGPEPVSLSGTTFDAEGILPGVYTLQYTPDEAPPVDCAQFSQVDLEIINSPKTGSAIDRFVCEGESEMVDLFDLLDNEDAGGAWREVSIIPSIGNAFNQTGSFNTEGQNAGIYDFEYAFNSIEPCSDVSTTVRVIIENLPVADAGEDQMLNCSQTEVLIGGSNSTAGSTITYLWTAENGSSILEPNSLNTTVEQPDTYILQVTDQSTGCVSTDIVQVDVDTDLPTFGAEVEDSPCFGYNAGVIIISSTQGGAGNYLYSIDSGQSWSDQTLFGNLAPGTYTVLLQDGNGCQSVQSGLVITEPEPLLLDAGEDREVEHGDDFYTLQIASSIDVTQIASIVWTENGTEICSEPPGSCMTIEVDPDGISNYCATITDVNGCVAEDCVVLRERVVRDVYIPNIFTPSSNDQNNTFYVHADEFIERISQFRIFDRWGEMIFQAVPDHRPNMSEFGWDGTFDDSFVVQGVYVYAIEVVYTDGGSEFFVGDVTVIR
ncbi:MAG: gliding motility-associated C-terminal domain-containing protein [Bacteroidia bacterium]|nr:gliding motility-associated C-terminal domain-containing protein [Bacteroidia bacterium]